MKQLLSLAATFAFAACSLQEANVGNTEHETVRWAIGLGDRGYESATAIAVDSIGDILVAGQGYKWPADLGNGMLGNYQAWGFLTKRVASDGSARWSKAFLGPEEYAQAQIEAIVVGPDDSIFVAGSYDGTVDFGGQTLSTAGPSDGFIAKYTTTGDLVWLWHLGAQSNSRLVSLSRDAAGNLFASGLFQKGSFTFHGASYAEVDGNIWSCLLSFDPSGTPRWGNCFTGTGSVAVTGQGLLANGDPIVTGTFTGTASFGGAAHTADASHVGFLVRYREDGLFLWSQPLADAQGGAVANLEVVAGDRIALVVNAAVSPYQDQLRLSQLDADGKLLWSSAWQDVNSSPLGVLGVRTDGNLVSSIWATDPNTTTTGHLEITTFDAGGNTTTGELGQNLRPAPRGTGIAATAAGPHGELALAGSYSGVIDLGLGPMPTRGTDDSDDLVLVLEPPTP